MPVRCDIFITGVVVDNAVSTSSAMRGTFAFNGHDIRIIDRDGNPWFLAQEICRVLGIANTSDATNYLDLIEVSRLKLTTGRGPSNLIISESGLYKLVHAKRQAAGQAVSGLGDQGRPACDPQGWFNLSQGP